MPAGRAKVSATRCPLADAPSPFRHLAPFGTSSLQEAYYSYEGTYEVNALVAGRGITGIAAIKPAPQKAGKRGPAVQA